MFPQFCQHSASCSTQSLNTEFSKTCISFQNDFQRISTTVSIPNDLNSLTNSKHSYYKTYLPLSIHFRDFMCAFLHQHNLVSFQLAQYVVYYRMPIMRLELAPPPLHSLPPPPPPPHYKQRALANDLNSSKAIAGKELSLSSW